VQQSVFFQWFAIPNQKEIVGRKGSTTTDIIIMGGRKLSTVVVVVIGVVIGGVLVVVVVTASQQLLFDGLNVDSRVQPETKRLHVDIQEWSVYRKVCENKCREDNGMKE
jgi:hypothetical protein